MSLPESWLESLREAALEFCQTVAIISGPPDIRPWNANQVLWAGRHAPAPSDSVFAYHQLPSERQVAILGVESRACFSRFVQVFSSEPSCREAYGEEFLRDMLIGLLQLSLPDAPLTSLPSPYWKRYVAPAVTQLRAESPERYAEAVVTAVKALPVPHPPTLVLLPLAGLVVLVPTPLAGVTLIPAAACPSDPDLSGCGMFLHRLKALRGRSDHQPLVFAKQAVPAEPGLAVQQAVARSQQVCRLLRLLPNPGLADGPLADPPRIDLDASDSAAFYIGETSVGTHPIPVRRTTSEPQGRLGNWRVEPRLRSAAWQRMASLIEAGARTDLEARLLTALHHLGEAVAEPAASAAVLGALTAITALLGPPESGAPRELAGAVGRLAAGGRPCAEVAAELEALVELGDRLSHDLDGSVSPEQRASAGWLAFKVLEAVLERPDLVGYRDLQGLLGAC